MQKVDMRTLIFGGSAIVLAMIAWVLYLEHDKRQFIESLPKLPQSLRHHADSATERLAPLPENRGEQTEPETLENALDSPIDEPEASAFSRDADADAVSEWESIGKAPEMENDENELSPELEVLFLGFRVFEEEMREVIAVLDPMIQEDISIMFRQQEISHELSVATDSATEQALYKERTALLAKEEELAPRIFEFQDKRDEIEEKRSAFLEKYGFSSRKEFFEIHRDTYRAWVAIGLPILLTLFYVGSVYPSNDLSVAELIHGVNQARLEIENGEVQYLFFYNYPAQKSEEEIAAWMQAEKEKELKAFTPDAFFPNIGLKEFEEQYLIPNLNYWAKWERARTDIEKTSMAFQILAPDETSFPTLYQYKMTIEEEPGITLESQASQFPQPSLFYHLSYDTQLQVKEDIGNIIFAMPSVRTWSSDYHAGFHHLWAFGRAGYRVPDSAKFIGKEQIDGASCYVLAFEREDGKHAQIWIDPEKAFCIRRFESYENPESSIIKDIAEYKKFQRRGHLPRKAGRIPLGDVWYPTVIQSTLYDKKGGVRSSYGFHVFSAEFNVNFPKDFFKIDGDFYLGQ